jgi:hypothetical protein
MGILRSAVLGCGGRRAVASFVRRDLAVDRLRRGLMRLRHASGTGLRGRGNVVRDHPQPRRVGSSLKLPQSRHCPNESRGIRRERKENREPDRQRQAKSGESGDKNEVGIGCARRNVTTQKLGVRIVGNKRNGCRHIKLLRW